MSSNSLIGLSRNQRVFIALEATAGTLEWPIATQDYIRPAGNATVNQNPAFVDSEELSSTLDLLDQFQNALPAGAWEVPLYVRPSGTVGTRPQGYDLFKSLQGTIGTSAMTLNGAITISIATMHVDGLDGKIPHVGVVLIGSEKIRYEGITQAGASAATLLNLTRGYGSTTATEHTDDAAVTLSSIWFKQSITQPSLTVWVETDHFVQALTGATVNRAVFGVTNEGALKLTCGGQGMRMYWAGTSALTTNAIAAATQITVANAKLYSVGMRVYNKTQNLTNTGDGWTILGRNTSTNVVRLDAAVGVNWATADLVAGYLPAGTTIGDPIEGRDSTVKLNSVAASLKSMDLNLDLPKKYIEDEIGTTAPEDYIEDRRTISSTMALYFRRADAKYFQEGYDGNELPVCLTFGDTAGSTMEIYLPRCILEVPAINFAPPAVELSMPFRALGTTGEDSCEILFH